MFQPLSAAIGLRYLRAKRRNGFISFLSLASILGIILGVVALITTIAVMSGFQQELRERSLGMVAHATVSGVDGPLQDWQRAVELAGEDPRVLGAAPYVETETLIQGRRRQGALLRGVEPSLEPRMSQLADKMKQGRLDDLQPGEYIKVYIAQTTVTPLGSMPRARRFTVAGIFEAGAQEYDLGLAVIHLQDAQALTRMGDGVTCVRLRLDDLWDAWNVARDLAD